MKATIPAGSRRASQHRPSRRDSNITSKTEIVLLPPSNNARQDGKVGLYERRDPDIPILLPGLIHPTHYSAPELLHVFAWGVYVFSGDLKKILPKERCAFRRADMAVLIHLSEALCLGCDPIDIGERRVRVCGDALGRLSTRHAYNAQELVDCYAIALKEMAGLISREMLPSLPASEAAEFAESLAAAETVTALCGFATELDEEEKGNIFNPTKIQFQAITYRLKALGYN